MLDLAGFSINEIIHEGHFTIVYRAKKNKNNQKIVVKALKDEHLGSLEIARLKSEYKISSMFNSPFIVKAYELIEKKETCYLLVEDFGGVDIARLDLFKSMDIKHFLESALDICNGLIEIHGNNVIHKDIKPENIICNPTTGELKLTDFGIATHFNRENQEMTSPEKLEGSIQYISPEQTGRMNRTIDYRTDFYSLGVTFYELLTAKLPFESNDLMEIIHWHIAKIPTPPHHLRNDIPEAVSSIIMKLLSKDAESRYQSASGIKFDIETCLNQWNNQGYCETFPLAQKESTDKLYLPQRLYGREKEIQFLFETYRKVSQGSTELMLVSGYSGIGKTALINEIYKPITATRGYFLQGKFDQFLKNLPYSAIISAFSALVKQLLSQSDVQINYWKEKINKALGNNSNVLIEVIPELELILGSQPDLVILDPTEAQNRFNMVFEQFITLFAQQEHPLTLFLDDLQWVDSASLQLLETLIRSADRQYLFIIGSYRDNEVDASHILQHFLDNLTKNGHHFDTLQLQALQLNDVNDLLSDALSTDTNKTLALSVLVYSKTQGNPFFVNEFIYNLYYKKLLQFDYKMQIWQWNLPDIEKERLTDNVVELMTERIILFDKNCQNLLSIASCMGNTFSLKELALIQDLTLNKTLSILWESIVTGLIIPDRSVNHLTLTEENHEFAQKNLALVNLTFLHDRVQEAANKMLKENNKSEIHYRIGQTLLKNLKEDEIEEQLFDITNHLNQAHKLIKDEKRKNQLIELNLRAGKKARLSTAYSSAVSYFKNGISLLNENHWENQYIKAKELYLNCADAMYLAGDLEQAQKLIDLSLDYCKTNIEKGEFYLILMHIFAIQGNYIETIETQVAALKMFGIEIPDIYSKEKIDAAFQEELKKYKNKMKGRSISSLLELPEMDNEEIQIATAIIMYAQDSMYFAIPELFSLTTIISMGICLDYGHSKMSSVLYAFGSEILFSTIGDFKSAYEYGQLAFKLDSKFGGIFSSKVMCGNAAFGYHWGASIKEDIHLLEKAIQAGKENGDHIYTGYSLAVKIRGLIGLGQVHLDDIIEIAHKDLVYLKKIKQEPIVYLHKLVIQHVNSFIGKTDSPISYSNQEFDEEKYLQLMDEQKFILFRAIYHNYKIINYYFFHYYKEAIEESNKLEQYSQFLAGLYHVAEQKLFTLLSYIGLYDDEPQLNLILEHYKQLKQWAEDSPDSFLHYKAIVDAELARIQRKENIEELYSQSIEINKAFGAYQYEGLAYELAGNYYLKQNNLKKAKEYIKCARNQYYHWGALLKAKDIENKFPEFFKISKTRDKSTTTIQTSTIMNSKINLDLESIIKASQAISSELDIKNVIHKILKILIEFSGARQALLFLKNQNDQRLYVEAELSIDSEFATFLESVGMDSRDDFSKDIVNYVHRSQETVVLMDAENDPTFKGNYILDKHPKSILCTPLIRQDLLIGIVYLENEIATSVFTEERVDLVKVISSQACISLENAQLIEELKEKERLKQEIAIAKKIQTAIVPHPPDHPDFEITVEMLTAEEVGGDYYDVVFDKFNRLWFAIGDVSGHGLSPGIIMMMAESSFLTSINLKEGMSPNEVIHNINETLFININKRLKDMQFMSFNAFLYNGNGHFSFAGAHEDILIYRNRIKQFEKIKTQGAFLGLKPDLLNYIDNFELTLEEEDLLFLYTDGIIEVKDREDQLLGIDGFIDIITNNLGKPLDLMRKSIIEDVYSWCQNKQNDDITLLIIHYLGS